MKNKIKRIYEIKTDCKRAEVVVFLNTGKIRIYKMTGFNSSLIKNNKNVMFCEYANTYVIKK